MVKQSPARLDAVFAALANPTRRAIMERLARGGATVTELAAPFAMSLPAVSKHLGVLERAGLIGRRVEGRVHHLGLDPGPLRIAARWLEDHHRFWEQRLDALVRYVEDTNLQEDPSWTHRRQRPTSRFASSGGSRPRRRRSSRRGRRPRP